ncbi:MAG: RNA 3'-terminal phosphate cyclase [Desulfurococcaceae archaeon]
MNTPVRVDGSIGEGGGQILRYALALSALTLKPLEIYNIRARRGNPGLRPQHLTAVRSLAVLTNAEVKGAEVGSMSLVFKPRTRLCGDYTFDIGTAGSVSLVVQAILPVLLASDCSSHVTIRGGTNVPMSPPVDYMIHVFKYNLELFGAKFDIELKRRGHYPRGGGLVELYVEPIKQPLKPIDIVSRSKPTALRIISHCVKLPHHVARRQADAAAKILRKIIGIEPEVDIETYPPEKDPHLGPGSGILVYVETFNHVRLGGDAVGEKGKPAEVVGEEAARVLVEDYETGMAFDRHMGDMLIPYMFLAKGVSRAGVARITMHLLTAIEIAKMFLPDASVKVDGELNKPGVVTVSGVGFSP